MTEDNAFKPKLFTSNRKFHREFWDWIDPPIHERNIKKAQDILQGYFNKPVVTFVPPGNVFTEDTLKAAEKHGLCFVNCQTQSRMRGDQVILGNEQVVAFHDRELVLYGIGWLKDLIAKHSEKEFYTVGELAQFTKASQR